MTATLTRETPSEALNRIQSGCSKNDELVIIAFAEAGVHPDDIEPRVNVLTLKAWTAKGRRVAKGASALTVQTWRPKEYTNKRGEQDTKLIPTHSRLFHISQTVAEPGEVPAAWDNPILVKPDHYTADGPTELGMTKAARKAGIEPQPMPGEQAEPEQVEADTLPDDDEPIILAELDEKPEPATKLDQYAKFKASHPDCVLLFRMGDFYEAFKDDATTLHKVLGVTLTQRTAGVPMAGVPYHSVDGYLRELIQAGHRVAICDQDSLTNVRLPEPAKQDKPRDFGKPEQGKRYSIAAMATASHISECEVDEPATLFG